MPIFVFITTRWMQEVRMGKVITVDVTGLEGNDNTILFVTHLQNVG